ncbi:hypothetical protein HDV00_002257 [Rhizophlyctis rosea]|nr:hypothetical protein HDV00_002257 [Rhizophlyctis rosea]
MSNYSQTSRDKGKGRANALPSTSQTPQPPLPPPSLFSSSTSSKPSTSTSYTPTATALDIVSSASTTSTAHPQSPFPDLTPLRPLSHRTPLPDSEMSEQTLFPTSLNAPHAEFYLDERAHPSPATTVIAVASPQPETDPTDGSEVLAFLNSPESSYTFSSPPLLAKTPTALAAPQKPKALSTHIVQPSTNSKYTGPETDGAAVVNFLKTGKYAALMDGLDIDDDDSDWEAFAYNHEFADKDDDLDTAWNAAGGGAGNGNAASRIHAGKVDVKRRTAIERMKLIGSHLRGGLQSSPPLVT